MADPTAFDEQQDRTINQLRATVAELSHSQVNTEAKLDHALAIIGPLQKLLEPAMNIEADIEKVHAKIDSFVAGPFAELKKIVDDVKAFVDKAKSKFKTGF